MFESYNTQELGILIEILNHDRIEKAFPDSFRDYDDRSNFHVLWLIVQVRNH